MPEKGDDSGKVIRVAMTLLCGFAVFLTLGLQEKHDRDQDEKIEQQNAKIQELDEKVSTELRRIKGPAERGADGDGHQQRVRPPKP